MVAHERTGDGEGIRRMYMAAPRTVCDAAAGRVCTVTRLLIDDGKCEVIQDGPPMPPSDPVINPEWPLLGEVV